MGSRSRGQGEDRREGEREEGVVAGGLTAGGGSGWVTAGHNHPSAVSVRLAVGEDTRLPSWLRFTGEGAGSTRTLRGTHPHAFGSSHCGGIYSVSRRE